MVTILVPCYNAEQYLNRCIDSVLDQTDHDIELVLVNDGSTDQSGSIVEARREEIEETLSRFVYIEQSNQGVGAACCTGFGVATGKYLMLLDADDRLLPESVEKCRSFLDGNPDYALVRTNGYYVPEMDPIGGRSLMKQDGKGKQNEYIFEDLLFGNAYGWAGTYMIRMCVLDQIYPDRKIFASRSGQNLQFVMMASFERRAGYIDLPLMEYYTHENSLSRFSSGDALQKELEAMKGYMMIRKYLVDHYIPSEYQSRLNYEIDQFYLGYKMRLASRFGDFELMEDSFRKLSSPTMAQKMAYFQMLHPTLGKVFRGFNRGIRFMKRNLFDE